MKKKRKHKKNCNNDRIWRDNDNKSLVNMEQYKRPFLISDEEYAALSMNKDILLCEDIFCYVFDFLRKEELFDCQFLTRRIHQLVHNKIVKNEEVVQIRNLNDFIRLTIYVYADLSFCDNKEQVTTRLANALQNGVHRYICYSNYIPSSRKVYEKVPIHKIYVNFHTECAIRIIENGRLVKKVRFASRLYNGYDIFHKYRPVKGGSKVTTTYVGTRISDDEQNHCVSYFRTSDYLTKKISKTKKDGSSHNGEDHLSKKKEEGEKKEIRPNTSNPSAKLSNCQECFGCRRREDCGSCLICTFRLSGSDLKQGCYARECVNKYRFTR